MSLLCYRRALEYCPLPHSAAVGPEAKVKVIQAKPIGLEIEAYKEQETFQDALQMRIF